MRVTLVVIIVSTTVLICGCRQDKGAPDAGPGARAGTLAAQLIGLNMVALPDTPTSYEPGTVLRDGQHVVAWASEAYVHPEQLQPRLIEVGADGNYRDAVDASGKMDATLGRLLRPVLVDTKLAAHKVQWIETELKGLKKNSLSELQLEKAEFTPEVRRKLNTATNAVTIVQAVYSAETLRIRFRSDRGFLGTAEVKAVLNEVVPATVPGIGVENRREVSNTGELIYDRRMIGYEPYFRAGGDDTQVSARAAAELAALLAQNDVPDAQVSGTLVTARPTPDQLSLVAALTDQVVENDRNKSVLATRTTQFDAQIQDLEARIAQANADRASQEQAVVALTEAARQNAQRQQVLVRRVDQQVAQTATLIDALSGKRPLNDPLATVTGAGSAILASTVTTQLIPDDRAVAQYDKRLAGMARAFAQFPVQQRDFTNATFPTVTSALGEIGQAADAARQPVLRRTIASELEQLLRFANQNDRKEWTSAVQAAVEKLRGRINEPAAP